MTDTGQGQAGDTNLGYKTFLNGTLVSNIVLDTSNVATDVNDGRLSRTVTQRGFQSPLLKEPERIARPYA